HQQRAALAADPRHPVNILGAGWAYAAFALDKLDQHSCRLLVHRGVERVELIVGNMRKALEQRQERLAILRLPGGRERAHRPAVEAAHGSDNILATSQQPGELERTLDRFGARIAQERALDAGWQRRHQLPQVRRSLVVVKDLGAADQRAGLFADGRDDRGVGVAEVGRALAADTVDVLVALGIPQPRALAAHDRDRPLGIDAAGVGCLGGDNRFSGWVWYHGFLITIASFALLNLGRAQMLWKMRHAKCTDEYLFRTINA